MKKRSCRMTNEEKAIHEFAVKVRKMTDRQLYDFISAEKEVKADISKFLNSLEKSAIAGIGPVTVKKIRVFAVKEGFVVGD